MKFAAILVALFTVGCGSSPVAPSTPPTDLTYAINLPGLVEVQSLLVQYPNGLHLSPVDAQTLYDRRAFYGGTPNVYAGAVTPTAWIGGNPYHGVGVVIAPFAVASVPIFKSTDWPDSNGQPFSGNPTTRFAWLGRFVYVPSS